MSRPTTARRLACLAVLLAAALPAVARGQATPPAGGARRPAGGGRGGAAAVAELRAGLDEMTLPAEQKAKLDAMLQDAVAQLRQAAQDARDAPADEQQQKRQDAQKMAADVKAKVLAELTPEQKVELAHKVAVAAVARSAAGLAAEKKAADGLAVPADQKTQSDNVLDDAAKTLDGYKADADAVKDDAAGTALAAKVQTTMTETNRSLADILGADDARTVQRAGAQAMRPAGGGNRRRAAATQPA